MKPGWKRAAQAEGSSSRGPSTVPNLRRAYAESRPAIYLIVIFVLAGIAALVVGVLVGWLLRRRSLAKQKKKQERAEAERGPMLTAHELGGSEPRHEADGREVLEMPGNQGRVTTGAIELPTAVPSVIENGGWYNVEYNRGRSDLPTK